MTEPEVPLTAAILDPDLQQIASKSERADLTDISAARRQMDSTQLPTSEAWRRYGPVVDLEEFSLSTSTGDRRITAYLPRGVSEPPGMVLLHGGGFVGGDRRSEHARALRYAAEAGYAVFSPDYALAPEEPYPAAVKDCIDAVEAISTSPHRFGIAGVPLVLAGVSAGAALASAVVLAAATSGTPTEYRGLMLLFPVLDDAQVTDSVRRFTDTPVWDSENTARMWTLYLAGAEADALAAPARAPSLAGMPRTYIAIAEHDPLRDEAVEFARRLLRENVSVDIRLWSDTFHVFDQLVPEASVSESSVADQVAFLRRLR